MPSTSILVTGASTGIGEACALHLDGLGHRVFAGVRKQADGERLRARASSRLTPLLLDVTDAASVAAASAGIADTVGPDGLQGLVNNAGIAVGGPLEYLPLEDWRLQFEVNVIGQIAVTRALLGQIRAGRGRIVFIGSSSGRISVPLMGPYGASKHALEAIAESLRHELRPWSIPVVLVEPGAIKTAIWDKGRATVDEMETRLPLEARERYRSFIDAVREGIDAQEKAGIPALAVARVVERSLFGPRPRARWLVGVDAKVQGLIARLLPDGVRDAVVRRFVGL